MDPGRNPQCDAVNITPGIKQLLRALQPPLRQFLRAVHGDLAQAIARQESGRLTKIPGIGKKTAERLLLELKGKLADALPSATFAVEDSQHDILNALLALGYNDREASAAMKQLPAGLSTSDGIRQALKLLSKV